eukprot:TRINITY_DN2399_c0_g1_i2.p1 TRINITY_DN2399_c0_g1~~TRINITY_DN2399_c0_g1_i2.p1  ORF type:complete len:116 (-),score=19.43 TRINITY_DN2399_c0_g1_i2:152-475(-)
MNENYQPQRWKYVYIPIIAGLGGVAFTLYTVSKTKAQKRQELLKKIAKTNAEQTNKTILIRPKLSKFEIVKTWPWRRISFEIIKTFGVYLSAPIMIMVYAGIILLSL